MRFLDSLGIPIIAIMRDSQNFVHAAEGGIGICEMAPYRVRKDIEQLEKVVGWLDGWQNRRHESSEPQTSVDRSNVTPFPKSRFSSF
jgi:chromosome partitioning protein